MAEEEVFTIMFSFYIIYVLTFCKQNNRTHFRFVLIPNIPLFLLRGGGAQVSKFFERDLLQNFFFILLVY